MRELIELTAGLTPQYHAALLQEIGIEEKVLLECASLPIGSRIRRGLDLARLTVENFKAPDPPNMDLMWKEQQKHLRKWRRGRARHERKFYVSDIRRKLSKSFYRLRGRANSHLRLP